MRPTGLEGETPSVRSRRGARGRGLRSWRRSLSCSWRLASRTSRCAPGATKSKTACSGAPARRVSSPSKWRPIRRRATPGIEPGDILLAVNGAPVETPGDVIEYQHSGTAGTRLVLHAAAAGKPPGARGVAGAGVAVPSSMYFVLAAVGLFTLLVGASVRLRRPRDQATLHFFWLCVAFFGAFTFSFNGPFDRLDWVFYWGDAVAMALLPPLLLHFTLVFPERPPIGAAPTSSRCCSPLMYLPALLLVGRRASWPSRAAGRDGPCFSHGARHPRSRRAGVPVRLRGGRGAVLVRGVRADHVAHRTPPASVDRLGHGAGRRARSRSATRCRGRSASIRRSRCS